MANPYSMDLRERVVAACEQGDTKEEVAERFGVSVSFVYAMVRLSRSGSALQPKPHTGGFKSRLDESAKNKIVELVKARPDATLVELCQGLRDSGGPSIQKSQMGLTLQTLGLKRKKDAVGL